MNISVEVQDNTSPIVVMVGSGGDAFAADHPADTTAHAAEHITYDGDIPSSNVMDALEWLDDNKLPIAGGTLTGQLVTRAGATGAGTAPIKMVSGPLMTTPQAGSIEYNGGGFYFTSASGVRKPVATSVSIRTTQTVVPAASTAVVTGLSIVAAANTVVAARMIEMVSHGTITQRNHADSFYTIQVKLNSTVLLSFTTPISTALAAKAFQLDVKTTIRTIGASGTCIAYGGFDVDGIASSHAMGTEQAIDTTSSNTLSIVIFANENNAGTGPVNLEIGRGVTYDIDA